jgi:hypothetical protein
METMKTSRLSIFQAYDYFHVTGAKRDLSRSEKAFFDYCCANHDEICDNDTADDAEVIKEASELYCMIY